MYDSRVVSDTVKKVGGVVIVAAVVGLVVKAKARYWALVGVVCVVFSLNLWDVPGPGMLTLKCYGHYGHFRRIELCLRG